MKIQLKNECVVNDDNEAFLEVSVVIKRIPLGKNGIMPIDAQVLEWEAFERFVNFSRNGVDAFERESKGFDEDGFHRRAESVGMPFTGVGYSTYSSKIGTPKEGKKDQNPTWKGVPS